MQEFCTESQAVRHSVRSGSGSSAQLESHIKAAASQLCLQAFSEILQFRTHSPVALRAAGSGVIADATRAAAIKATTRYPPRFFMLYPFPESPAAL
jgi:hypothetical protein